MDIEEEKSAQSEEESNFAIEPVTFKIPVTKSPRKRLLQTHKVKMSKNINYDPDEKIKDLYRFYKGVLENKKKNVIEQKNQRLGSKIYQALVNQLHKKQQINIATIKVYPNYHTFLSLLYNELENKLSEITQIQNIVININRKISDLQELIAHITLEIENNDPYGTSKDKQGKRKPKAYFLFFLDELEGYNLILSDFCKYFLEEILEGATTQLFFIFPNISSTPLLPDHDFNLSKFQISSPKKMFAKLIVELLLDKRIFPILSGSIINELLNEFEYFEFSFERAVQKLHLITQEYLLSVKDKHDIVELIDMLGTGDEELEDILYGKLRKSVLSAIAAFLEIEKGIFKQKKDIPLKLLEFLSQKEILYTLPLSLGLSLQTLEDGISLVKAVNNVFKTKKNDEFKFICEKLKDLESPESIKTSAAKSRSKTDKRTEQLLQKQNKKEDPSASLAYLKSELANYIRMFLKLQLVDKYNEIGTKFPNLCYSNMEGLRQSAQPDLLGWTYTALMPEGNQCLPRYESSFLLEILHDFGVKVDVCQMFDAFRDKYQKQYPNANRQNVEEAFIVGLNELKYLGLISETRKAKLTIQKNFFAKTFFREKQSNYDDDDDDDD